MNPRQRILFQTYKRMWRVAPFMFRPRPSRASVLLYHNVDDAPSSFVRRLGVTMSTADFESHIRYLARSHRVVPLSQLARHAHDPRDVAITFDDGYRSVRTVALPILEKYGMPFKAFVLAAESRSEINWLNQLSFLLDRCPPDDLEELVLRATGVAVPRSRLGDPTPFVEHFVEHRTPDAIAEVFAARCDEPVPELYLNEEDIRALAAHPLVELGSHTRNHFPLHRLSRESIEVEVVEAHRALQERFGDAIEGFCPPFGDRHHITRDVVAAVRKIDRTVVTAYGGRHGHRHVHGHPEVRRVGAWGNLGVLWHNLSNEPK